jgi:uracil-DNA glycosylase family 4
LIAKPAGDACLTCPARDAKLVLPEYAKAIDPDLGRPRARLAIVGEAPGRNELSEGRPFVGASGKMLMRGLRTIDLDRRDVHWTNAVLCECSQEDQPKAAAACATRLRRELAEVAAPVVMPVGVWGLKSTLGLTKKPQIMKWRGSVTEVEFSSAAPKNANQPTTDFGLLAAGSVVSDGAIEASKTLSATSPKERDTAAHVAERDRPTISLVAPTLHPAYIMRVPAWGPVLETDVARVGRLIRGNYVPPERAPGRRIVIARNEKVLLRELELLRDGELGADVETLGLGPTETPLVCFGLSDGTNTLIVPWSKGRNGKDPWWSNPLRIGQIVSEKLTRCVAITHNGPAFDHIVFERHGIKIGAWDDTLNGRHVVASHYPKNLAFTVTQYLDVPAWKQQEDRTADLERLWFYNARDTLYTILAWAHIKPKVSEAA